MQPEQAAGSVWADIAASFLTKLQGLIYLSVPRCITSHSCTMNPIGPRRHPVPGERGPAAEL